MRFPLAGPFLAVFLLQALAGNLRAMEIQPFQVRNQSPLVQIFGLPPAEGGRVTPSGKTEGILLLDLASVFSGDEEDNEDVYLDGEIYRFTLALRQGFGQRWEAGIDLPYLWHTGGHLDSVVDGFHRTFHLPEGGRNLSARDLLRYSSTRNGQTTLLLDEPQSGMGDLLLSLGWQLWADEGPGPGRSLALRGALKLPTGDAQALTGSGSTDYSLRLAGSDGISLAARHITLFGTLGAMAMSQGEVLAAQQRDYVLFGTAGFGWQWLRWLALKLTIRRAQRFFSRQRAVPARFRVGTDHCRYRDGAAG